MKKESLLLFVVPVVLLFLGLFSGFYFGVYRTSLAVTACEIEKALTPASLLVTDSYYNDQTKQLYLELENPGGMPIELLTKTLVLQPANGRAPIALAMQIPLGMVMPPYSTLELKLDLTSQGSGFALGDVLVSTITYRLPISNDVYSVVHLFKNSGKTNEKGLVKNALQSNSEVRANYEKQLKQGSQNQAKSDSQTQNTQK